MTGPRWLTIAGILGAIGILIGAFGAHSLPKLSGTTEQSLEWLNTGVEYHVYHVLALFGLGILKILAPDEKWNFSGYCFLVGMTIFSGLLYIMAVTQMRILGAIVWIGGVSFVIGWASLAWTASKMKK